MPPFQLNISRGDTSQTIRLTQNNLIIGKQLDTDIYLESPRISRQHARLSFTDDVWTLHDLNSLNGTYLNGKRIKKRSFRQGDVVRISDFKLTLEPINPSIPPKEIVIESLKKKLNQSSPFSVPKEALKERLGNKLDKMLEQNCISFQSKKDRSSYIHQQLKNLLGLGFLEDYLSDPTINEIMINGHQSIYIERECQVIRSDASFPDESKLRSVIDKILAPIGRHVDEASPLVDARLPDGSRLHVALPPISLNGPVVTIRKFSRQLSTMDDLIQRETLSSTTAEILKSFVLNRKSIVVSGGTSSGKTTLLNVLSYYIPNHERLITIEDSAELQLKQAHTIRMESRPPNIEHKGEITIRRLVQNALRMRPDRLIVGECRSAEAFDMLQAMNTGHDGSLSTCHSNSPRDTLKRLENMAMMAAFGLPLQTIREQIASAIDIIVHMKRTPSGKRAVSHITKICGMDKETILTQDIFDSTKGDRHAIN